MVIIVLLGVLAGGTCLWFWKQELTPFIEYMDNIKNITGYKKVFMLLKAIPLTIPFITDLFITMLFQVIFSMGTGLAGGMVALWISNIFSFWQVRRMQC